MKKIKFIKNKFSVSDEIDFMYEKTITRFGTGAKIDAIKKHLGKKVYVLVCK